MSAMLNLHSIFNCKVKGRLRLPELCVKSQYISIQKQTGLTELSLGKVPKRLFCRSNLKSSVVAAREEHLAVHVNAFHLVVGSFKKGKN